MRLNIPARVLVAALAAVSLFCCVLTSCSRARADLRSLAPEETIIYLESPDLGALIRSMTSSEAFRTASPAIKDLSALDGIEIAVAVTGFEASESKVTDEEAVLNFKPSFTLLAETHAWSWQMDQLVTGVLGGFVRSSYGDQAKPEKSRRDGMDWYIWSAADGRKAFAAVSGSRVFFGNSEEGVSKCLRIQAGEEPSLRKNSRLSRQYENSQGKLAFGYVSQEGVKQLSSFAGISVALDRSDDADAQSVISSIFPQLIDNSVTEIVWTAKESPQGIEDELSIRLDPKLSEAFSEALKPANTGGEEMFRLVPADAYSVTRYNLGDPRLAFRSLVIGAAGKVSPEAARFVPALGAALLEPYGIVEPETFLAAVDPFILTVRMDPDGDEGVAIVKAMDFQSVGKSFPDVLKNGRVSSIGDNEIVVSEDGSLAAGRKDMFVVLGDRESVEKCLRADASKGSSGTSGDIRFIDLFAEVRRPEHTAVTVGRDRETAAKLASVFGDSPGTKASENYFVIRTDFDRQGMRRSYLSPFGFAGSIIVQIAGSP